MVRSEPNDVNLKIAIIIDVIILFVAAAPTCRHKKLVVMGHELPRSEGNFTLGRGRIASYVDVCGTYLDCRTGGAVAFSRWAIDRQFFVAATGTDVRERPRPRPALHCTHLPPGYGAVASLLVAALKGADVIWRACVRIDQKGAHMCVCVSTMKHGTGSR